MTCHWSLSISAAASKKVKDLQRSNKRPGQEPNEHGKIYSCINDEL